MKGPMLRILWPQAHPLWSEMSPEDQKVMIRQFRNMRKAIRQRLRRSR